MLLCVTLLLTSALFAIVSVTARMKRLGDQFC